MSDAHARPEGFSGFVLRERFRTIDADMPDYDGLTASIRTNLTNAEREEFILTREELDQAVRDDQRKSLEAAKKLDAAVANARTDKEREIAVKKRETFLRSQVKATSAVGRQRLALVAPYIKSWNICTDTYEPAPLPKDDLDTAFAVIDEKIVAWLYQCVAEGHRGGPKEPSSSKTSDAAPEPTPEPSTESGKD